MEDVIRREGGNGETAAGAIRMPGPRELPRLREIEVSAGRPFSGIGMPEIAEDDPPSLAELDRYRAAGRVLVAGDPPSAYLMWDPVDGCAHIEQVSVHQDAARQGLGRGLIDRLAEVTGLPLTLTTFRDVPWNAPYYARLGFRVLSAEERTPGLRRIRAQEAAHGLDRWPRVCMRREAGV